MASEAQAMYHKAKVNHGAFTESLQGSVCVCVVGFGSMVISLMRIYSCSVQNDFDIALGKEVALENCTQIHGTVKLPQSHLTFLLTPSSPSANPSPEILPWDL